MCVALREPEGRAPAIILFHLRGREYVLLYRKHTFGWKMSLKSVKHCSFNTDRRMDPCPGQSNPIKKTNKMQHP